MSKTVDERVVSMQFDNKNFEKNVKTSMSTLDKLKAALKLDGAKKGLEDVEKASKKISFEDLEIGATRAGFHIQDVWEKVTRFLENNIARRILNIGTNIATAFTIDPIKTGLQEYETQINAVQTILANTSSKGTTLKEVNAALDELNTYADKTIYNFTEMTRNIGTFTAAGLGLKTSTAAIQGIANVAAVSGSTSQQASTAMYQLSQALSSGTVKLQDWNSVVNAGMGGQVFQDALKETSRECVKVAERVRKMSDAEKKAYQEQHKYTDDQMKTIQEYGFNVDSIIEKEGSFRESLSQGWITSDVLARTLNKFTKSGVVEYLAEMTGQSEESVKKFQDLGEKTGYDTDEMKKLAKELANGDESMAKVILDTAKMANTAEDAATKVKTFSQLMDTLKEAAQSGWTQTWEILIGDFEEAKKLWTGVSDYFGEAINNMSEARNSVLEAWAKDGGRTDVIDSIKNAFNGLLSVLKPIKEAFDDVFGKTTEESVKMLSNLTKGLKEFTAKLKLSEERAAKVKDIFKGLFSVLNIFKKILGAVAQAIGAALGTGGLGKFVDLILSAAAAIGRFLTSLDEGFDSSGFAGVLKSITTGIANMVGALSGKLLDVGHIIPNIGNGIISVLGKVWGAFKNVFSFIRENVSAGDIFAGLAGGGIFATGLKLVDLIDTVKEKFEGLFKKGEKKEGIIDKFKNILGEVKESLQTFTSGVKVAALVAIAVAIALLSASLRKISEISVGDITKSISAIAVMMVMLNLTLKSMTKTLSTFDSGGLIKAGLSLVFVAYAIKILAGAMEQIGAMPLSQIGKGLIGIGVALFELSIALKIIDKVKIPLKTSVAILALAKACKMLADALAKFGSMSWNEIKNGLSAMAGALMELSLTLVILQEAGGMKALVSSVALLIVVKSLDDLYEALKKFGSMSWDEIKHGLTAMGGALIELTATLAILGKVAGFSSIFAGVAIVIVIKGLDKLADALKKFGEMNWGSIGRGLTAMGGALGEIAIICGALGVIAGFSGIIGSASIAIVIKCLDDLANALIKFGSMNWGEIGRGLTAMGLALGEVGLVSALTGLAGLSGIIGAASIAIVIKCLDDLANALKKFGEMSWGEIGRGLTAMGAALGEVGLAGALTGLAGLSGLVGGGTILMVVQGLDDIANALKKFGEMSWSEIGRGLTAMGVALGEIAWGGLLNTFSFLGNISIAKVAEPLGVLADSVKKWEGVKIPSDLGIQLGILAAGIGPFTYDIVAAASLALVAEPIGVLAESISKWSGVSIPEGLGGQLAKLANGIFAFSNDIVAAGSIALVAEPLGAMADSIRNWQGVTVSDDLAVDLQKLATAIKSFTWGFMAGWSLSTIADPLAKLADTMKKWGSVYIKANTTDGLKKLGDAIKSFTWGFMAGWSLSTIVEPLAKLANSMTKWNLVFIKDQTIEGLKKLAEAVKSFTWGFAAGWSLSTIVDPLTKLATAMTLWQLVTIKEETITGLKDLASSVKSFTTGFAAGWSLSTIVEPLGKLATSMYLWQRVTIKEETISGLKGLASAVKSFTWGFAAGWSLSTIVDPLAKLATSVTLWKNVTIKEETIEGLKKLASAVKSFTTGFAAGWSLSTIVEPLGKLAISMALWHRVTIKEETITGLKNLAGAVKSFTTGFAAGWSLSTIAEPLGILATSMDKWKTVTISEDTTKGLKELASAVKSFTFGFGGGLTLSNVAEPLGTLGDSMSKWQNVTISEETTNGLKNLASAVKSFSSGWAGGLSLSTAVEPLSKLADSMKKWGQVTIKDNTVEGLKKLADAVKSFSSGWAGGWTISTIAEPMYKLAGAIVKVSSVVIPEGIGEKIKSVSSAIGDFAKSVRDNGVNNINTEHLSNLANTIKTLGSVLSGVLVNPVNVSNFVSAVNQLGSISIDGDTLATQAGLASTAISQMMETMTSIISKGKNSVSDAMKGVMQGISTSVRTNSHLVKTEVNTMLEGVSKCINTKKETIVNSFKRLLTGIANAIKDNTSVKTATYQMTSSVVNAVRASYQSFYGAGKYLVEGFARGISDETFEAEAAAKAMAEASYEAARKKLDINSPSKLFRKMAACVPEGFAQGITRNVGYVKDSSEDMAMVAYNTTKDAMSRVADIINGDSFAQPTIRPVVDLSAMQTKTLDIGANLNVSISRPINSLAQVVADAQANMDSSNREITNAIESLRSDLSELYSMVDAKDSNVYLDSKVMANKLAKPMNRELSNLARRGAY